MMCNAFLTVRRPGTPVNSATGYKKREPEPYVVLKDVPVCFGSDTGSRRIGAGRGADHVKDVAKPAQVATFQDYNYDEIHIGDIAVLKPWAEKSLAVEYVVSNAERSVGVSGAVWFLTFEAPKFAKRS